MGKNPFNLEERPMDFKATIQKIHLFHTPAVEC